MIQFETLLVVVMVGLVCACTGKPGQTGSQGPQGPVGPSGPSGVEGPKGADGSSIVPVQFCPNVQPVYPAVFPEFALCINGALYGTYNQNTGYQYLALLPDGAYSSDGQGAACSFTITGCTVTY
jgi:hypothetical protein